jgi:hypothetical protein
VYDDGHNASQLLHSGAGGERQVLIFGRHAIVNILQGKAYMIITIIYSLYLKCY